MAKSQQENRYLVFLTEEAYKTFFKHYIIQYIHTAHREDVLHYWFDCQSVNPEGIYLRIVDAKPLFEEMLRPADFMIRHECVLYISSALPDKFFGFQKGK